MAKKPAVLHETPASASVWAGASRRDITPPLGIYARMWGAAKHDVSEGTHRPMFVTTLAVRKNKTAPPMLLVAVDIALLGDLGSDVDEKRVMSRVWEQLGLDRSQIIVNCSHTHAAPWAASSRASMPGGEMIGPFLEHLGNAVLESAREAIATAAPATMTWATGRCSLATNRDLRDPDKSKDRYICGYNPGVRADDTVIVGRVTRNADDRVIATVVNYACHPTTLAWLNKVISPDYIGSMRELMESHTGGAPCVFLQGASGELSPAHQYVGDVAVADKHGRQLGYAALSALESMLPPGQRLTYKGVMESGAPLAVWWPEPFEPSNEVDGVRIDVPLPLKPMPSFEELQKKMDATKDRALRERLFRKQQIVKSLSKGSAHKMPAWVWRLGGALIIAHPNEAYSIFQKELREAFPDYAVVVMNCAGPEVGYITPAELHSQNLYQAWQTPFDRGALKLLTSQCKEQAARLTSSKQKPKPGRRRATAKA